MMIAAALTDLPPGVDVNIGQASGWTLLIVFLTLFFRAVLGGRVHSDKSVQTMLSSAAAALAAESRRADLMQQAWEKSQEALDLRDASTHQLFLESTATMTRVLESIQALSNHREGQT